MIFHLKPVNASLDNPAWASSPYRGDCWVNATDEKEARGLVSGRYEDARANIPGVSSAPSPWMDPALVAAESHDAPPEGMSIPEGVVMGTRQI